MYLKGFLPQSQTLPITPTVRSVLPEMGGAVQGVLRPPPKSSRLRRGLAQTASRIASAMIVTVLLTSHAMAGWFWVQMADGWIY